MCSWFNQPKKVDKFLQRSDMSDEEFICELQLQGKIAVKTVNCCRIKLGESYRISPEIYTQMIALGIYFAFQIVDGICWNLY